MYTYRAKLIKVVDGDTVRLAVDCGFKLSFTDNFRLLGINAPERDAAATEALAAILMSAVDAEGFIRVNTTKPDKYGRWLVTILSSSPDVSVNMQMISQGFAVAYDGGNR